MAKIKYFHEYDRLTITRDNVYNLLKSLTRSSNSSILFSKWYFSYFSWSLSITWKSTVVLFQSDYFEDLCSVRSNQQEILILNIIIKYKMPTNTLFSNKLNGLMWNALDIRINLSIFVLDCLHVFHRKSIRLVFIYQQNLIYV